MKKVACLSISTLMALGLVGCSSSSDMKDVDALTMSQEIKQLSSEVDKLSRKLKESDAELAKLVELIPQKSTGTYIVTATRLNMRQDASTDLEAIGTIAYGTKLNIVDTSNPLWYKVELDITGYTQEAKDYETLLNFEGNSLEIKNSYMSNVNSFYVSSKYLSNQEVEAVNEAPIGDRPFVYGLTFYDDQTAMLLASEIWTNLENELKALGYTGVKVTFINRNTYEDDIRNGVYDVVESAPGQFAKINSEKEYMQVFAKDIINGETNYRGVIIVNKDSIITSPKQLKGKIVLTGKEYSESSYNYQKYYLKEIHNIDIEKDLKLEKDNYHQEIFYKVASGEAEVGFCGDFVMTNSFGDMKSSLAMSKINLESKEELEKLRDNVIILDMNELAPIPNNPHSIKSELSSNQGLVDKLYESVKKIYSNNKEGYDITNANNEEYEMLAEIE